MTMLLLKRLDVPLDRDVILLAESGEEGQSNLGIGHMMAEHYAAIDAEYCIAEGGDTIREKGAVRYATVQVIEKISRGVELTARGISGHGSVPLTSNAIAHLGSAVGTFIRWQPDVKIDETTGRYFRRLAPLASSPEQAAAYRDVVSPDPAVAAAAADWLWRTRAAACVDGAHVGLAQHLRRRLPLQRDSFGGHGAARRAHGAERGSRRPAGADHEGHQRPGRGRAVRGRRGNRPVIAPTRLDAELFTTAEAAVDAVYQVPTLPSMSTYATDMWPLRAKGVQCIGIGAGVDLEDQSAGYGMHGDQERLLEREFQRFVRFNWELVTRLARRH